MAKKTFLEKFRVENGNEQVELSAGNASERVLLQIRNTAFDKRIRTFAIVNRVPRVDIEGFLIDAFPIYENEMAHTVEEHSMVKSITILTA